MGNRKDDGGLDLGGREDDDASTISLNIRPPDDPKGPSFGTNLRLNFLTFRPLGVDTY